MTHSPNNGTNGFIVEWLDTLIELVTMGSGS